jgi:hypothetical protein
MPVMVVLMASELMAWQIAVAAAVVAQTPSLRAARAVLAL